MENRFSLIDEPWIPVVGKGLLSLRTCVECRDPLQLGGTPIEKVSLFKFFQALCQSACTPSNIDTWKALGVEGLRKEVLSYLDGHHDQFWLYGDHPFLQFPQIGGKTQGVSVAQLLTTAAKKNTTILFPNQRWKKRILSDSEKVLLLLTQMGFAFGWKGADNSLSLTKGYTKSKTAPVGPSLGRKGFLHSFFYEETLMETFYLNLLTKDDIDDMKVFSEGLGTAPWEQLPEGEDDSTAKAYRHSVMGRFIPLCRFMYYHDDGETCDYTEGLTYQSYKDGDYDLTCTVDSSNLDSRCVLCTDPEKRPWRELTSLLAFCVHGTSGWNNQQLRLTAEKLTFTEFDSINLWAGGLQVSYTSGESYLSGSNDYVESTFSIDRSSLEKTWFTNLQEEMRDLDKMEKKLFGSVKRYYTNLKAESSFAKAQASRASGIFWSLAEQNFPELLEATASLDASVRIRIRKQNWEVVEAVYSQICPNSTARQLAAWVTAKPFAGNILEEG